LSTSSNPGCLASIMRLFGIGSSQPSVVVNELPADPEPDPYPYRLRDDFLSPAEQSFYMVLKNVVGEYFTICPKVSLADVFFVIRPNENKSAYNRINRKHVDFLVCEPKTMKPRFAIELDDSSHKRPDREERDDFVDGVFNDANFPLIRIPARTGYNTAELGVLIKQTLQQVTGGLQNQQSIHDVDVSSPAPQAQPPDSRPFCPKCGVRMVLRTARQGTQTGKRFFGCPNYPKCREVIPFEQWTHAG
jgi:hypothetical protein